MTWYLQKTDGIYGPVDLTQLQHLATEGHLSPEDHVSENPEDGWMPAHQLSALGMDWWVMLEDGTGYGPYHILAIGPMLEEGEIDPETILYSQSIEESYTAATALCSALLEKIKVLDHLVESADEQIEYLTLPHEGNEENAPTGFGASSWREAMREKAEYQKSSKKWEHLYQEEREQNTYLREKTGTLEKQLTQFEIKSQNEVRRLQEKINFAEARLDELHESGLSQTGPAAVEMAQHELAAKFETVLHQLREKTSELNEAIQGRHDAEHEQRQLMHRYELKIAAEREEAKIARERAASMEESYHDLLRSYRDMNDRLIRIKDQNPSNRPPALTPPKPKAKPPTTSMPPVAEESVMDDAILSASPPKVKKTVPKIKISKPIPTDPSNDPESPDAQPKKPRNKKPAGRSRLKLTK